MAQTIKNLPAVQEIWVRFPGWKDPLEKGMATHSSILAQETHTMERDWEVISIWSVVVETDHGQRARRESADRPWEQ